MCDCKKNKSCCKDVTKTARGQRGKKGEPGVGPTGPIGLTGPQGLSGSNGANGINGTNGLQGIQGIQGPAGLSTMPMDTNWKDLIGFSHYTGAVKPQCRRIGNIIYFRGIAVVPLAVTNASTQSIALASFASYENQVYSATYTGANGCTISATVNGRVQFNLGDNCIPISVTGNLTQLDGDYVKKNIIATRDINIHYPTSAVTLSTVVSIGMTANKNLFIDTLQELELTNNSPTNILQSSPLHFISSNVALNDYVPNYKITTPVHGTNETNLHASPLSVGAGTHGVKAPYATQYPFAVNLGNPSQIGGLQIQLDGFHVFLETCNTETNFQFPCG
jgi:hypothetical protein